MAHVDPDDDTIRRFVVSHYAWDPARHERRHRVIAAYDDVAEFEQALDEAWRGTVGIDPRERWTGTVKEPGHDAQARASHLARRCTEHGVQPPVSG